MNKKGFLFSFLLLISCFFCIGNVSAVSDTIYFYKDTTLSMSVNDFYSRILKLTQKPTNFPYIYCLRGQFDTASNGFTHDCRSFKSLAGVTGTLNADGSLSLNFSSSRSASFWGFGHQKSFFFNDGTITNPYNVYNLNATISYSFSSASHYRYSPGFVNFDVYDSNGVLIHERDIPSYEETLNPDYTVNFHLNGGQSFDLSDIFNPTLHQNDYSLSIAKNDIHDYISHLTFLKSNYDFEGLYYDSDFTQPYSSSDTISSDIDLYVKWKSKIINVNDIDYIEFKFDDIPYTSTNIDYDFHFKTVTSDGHNETIQFSQPYGREYYTGCDDEGQNCTTSTKYKDSLFYDLDHISYDYTYENSLTFNSDPEHITNSYSVIVPLENVYGTYLYYDFNSEQDYEMIIHYKDDEDSTNSYLRTVDITGKYGAIFLPLYDNSVYADEGSYYLTRFKVVGNVDIQVTDSREMTGYNILQLYSMNYCNSKYLAQEEETPPEGSLYLDTTIPYSCDNTSGIFEFKIDNLTANQTLRFVNHSYTELSDRTTTITYDTRYFNYGVLDAPTSTVDIVDPTTGVTETVGLRDFYNQLDKASVEGSKVGFKKAFYRFLNPIKFIFRQVTNLYYNHLNGTLQHYFFIVFSLTLIILIIRVIF